LGKSVIKKNCLRCNREFFTKPVKNKETGKWEEKMYCQKCRHQGTVAKQDIRKDEIRVRVVGVE